MSRTAPTPLGDQFVVALLEVIDQGLELRRGDHARLIRVRTAPADGLDDEIEIGFRPIEPGRHPLDELVGFDAPPDWAAIGLAATGMAAPSRGCGGRPFPVRCIHLVDRSGAWASGWRPLAGDDGTAAPPQNGTAPPQNGTAALSQAGTAAPSQGATASSAGGDEIPTGRVDDALRRAIGVATGPPPPGGTLLLWAVIWLDALVTTLAAGASRRRRKRSRPAILGAHPAVTVLGLDPAALDVDQLVAAGRQLAGWRDWSQLRHACASTSWETPDLAATTAGWLDDGSFARWLLGTHPDLEDLHDALAALLAPSAQAVVDDVLAGWNLLPEHGPPVPDPGERGQ